ncbi:MAG: peroxidase [Alphaproteobacteria bacterium RIFCSPHIGHO2_02_FULL_46_13]|nr:MAG: peroxidase [Alphaproteobacteria bacterium RIFCSPHIGHO2_02_FULL_46_13]
MTQRLSQIDPAAATGKVKEIMDATMAKLKIIPNMYRVMATSPKVFEGYIDLNNAMNATSLSAKLKEQLAIAVAETNGCDYCLSAHTAIGTMLGVSADDLSAAQSGNASDAKSAAALQFARKVSSERGHVSDADLAAVKAAGYSDAEIVEIVAITATNILTNFVNNVAGTTIDFPVTSFNTKKVA